MKSKTITAIVAFFLAGSSHAQNTVSFKSNATLSSTCQIGAQDISFGEYKQNQDNFSNGLINYRCTKGTQPYVSIQWNNVLPCSNKYCPSAFGGSRSRAMIGTGNAAGETLFYHLFRNANYTQEAAGDFANPIADGTDQFITIYGAMASGQYVKPGNYGETLTLSFRF